MGQTPGNNRVFSHTFFTFQYSLYWAFYLTNKLCDVQLLDFFLCFYIQKSSSEVHVWYKRKQDTI